MTYIKNIVVVLVALSLSAAATAQAAGTLTSATPVAAPTGMRAWLIRYVTTDDRGLGQTVTAMVVAPAAASTKPEVAPRRVIAWTHGTWGTAAKCAPSSSQDFFSLTPALDAVARGYVVVAPDYPGLGSAGPHPYLVGTVTGRSVLDAVKAARAIREARAGSAFAVWGESQGGHAALWTGQLARTDGAGLRLVGVAAGAPPTDLAANLRGASDPSAKAYLLALTADSWSQYYNVPIRFGARTTPGIMRRIASNCIAGTGKKPRLGALLGIAALRHDLRNVDLPALPAWSSQFAANSTSPVSRVPVLFAQTRADPLVSPAVTRQFARRMCANRVLVRWVDLPGGDHATTAKQSAAATLNWIDARFAGASAPNDCGQF